MKSKIIGLTFILILISCEKEGDLTKGTSHSETVFQNSILKQQGLFTPTDGITVAGEVKIYLEGNQYKLKLDHFSITNGPDLKVYLSKSNTPTEIVNLGNLSLSMVYSIPLIVDISQYKYVLIHCQQYNHLFAIAKLIQI